MNMILNQNKLKNMSRKLMNNINRNNKKRNK